MRVPWSQYDSVPVDFSFLCKVISPWTSDEEITGIKNAINQGELDWSALAAYANRANLAPALRHALAAKCLWEAVPLKLQEYLEAMHQFNTERNDSILQHLYEVVGLLNSAGITPLLMKGGAAIAMDLYPDSAIRFMMDLDILVPDTMLMQSVAALKNNGYYTPEANLTGNENFDGETCKHYLPLVKDDRVAHIELHRKVLCAAEDLLLPTSNVWRDSRSYTNNRMIDVSFDLMSPTHQILHSIIHSEISHGNYVAQRLDLRQLVHFAYLCKRHSDSIDWQQVKTQMKDEMGSQALRAYLYSAEILLGVVTPLTAEAEADAKSKRHFAEMIYFHVREKRKIFRLITTEVAHIQEAFSEQGLKLRLPEHKNRSVGWLRLRYSKVLMNKFSTVEKLKSYVARKVHCFVNIG